MAGCGCGAEQSETLERRTLWILLIINAAMFLIELGFGWFAESTGLIADSLDMFADAAVYGISLYAVGQSVRKQADIASASGYIQIALGVGVLLEVARRLLFGSDPEGLWMGLIGLLALAANVSCMLLIAKHRNGGVHMRASWIFSTNDVIANLGLIISAALVAYLNSSIPDLLIGTLIAAVVVRGGFRILSEAKESRTI